MSLKEERYSNKRVASNEIVYEWMNAGKHFDQQLPCESSMLLIVALLFWRIIKRTQMNKVIVPLTGKTSVQFQQKQSCQENAKVTKCFICTSNRLTQRFQVLSSNFDIPPRHFERETGGCTTCATASPCLPTYDLHSTTQTTLNHLMKQWARQNTTIRFRLQGSIKFRYV